MRRLPVADGSFAAPAARRSRGGIAAPSVGSQNRGSIAEGATPGGDDDDNDTRVVRLTLDGDYEETLEGDAAAQDVYSIRLCGDVAQSLQVPKSQISVASLQAGSILANVRVSVPRPDTDSDEESKEIPRGVNDKSKSKGLTRSARDIAKELIAQANDPKSALRLRRPDVTKGELVSGSGMVQDSDDEDEMPEGDKRDRLVGGALGEVATEFGSREIPTLSAALHLRRQEAEEEEEEESDDEQEQSDDGIPLDLPRDRGVGGGDYFSDAASSSSDDIDPEDAIKARLKELLGNKYLPETRVCCAVTHRIFTIASIAGISLPSPPDSDNEVDIEEEDEEEINAQASARRRLARQKKDKFEARRAELQRPAERPGEFIVVPPWGLVISPQGADVLRDNDVVGLYAVDIQGAVLLCSEQDRCPCVLGGRGKAAQGA